MTPRRRTRTRRPRQEVIPPEDRHADDRRHLDEDRRREYRTHRARIGEALLRSALRLLATTEAVARVNELLEDRFRLEGVRLDDEVSVMAENLMRMEVAAILASSSSLPARQRRELVDRIVARIVPRRDDVAGAAGAARPTPPMRVEDLESVVRREMRRSGLKGASRPEGDR